MRPRSPAVVRRAVERQTTPRPLVPVEPRAKARPERDPSQPQTTPPESVDAPGAFGNIVRTLDIRVNGLLFLTFKTALGYARGRCEGLGTGVGRVVPRAAARTVSKVALPIAARRWMKPEPRPLPDKEARAEASPDDNASQPRP